MTVISAIKDLNSSSLNAIRSDDDGADVLQHLFPGHATANRSIPTFNSAMPPR